MKKLKLRLLGSTVLACCALGLLAIVGRPDSPAVPASGKYESNRPVIILDAGHGG